MTSRRFKEYQLVFLLLLGAYGVLMLYSANQLGGRLPDLPLESATFSAQSVSSNSVPVKDFFGSEIARANQQLTKLSNPFFTEHFIPKEAPTPPPPKKKTAVRYLGFLKNSTGTMKAVLEVGGQQKVLKIGDALMDGLTLESIGEKEAVASTVDKAKVQLPFSRTVNL